MKFNKKILLENNYKQIIKISEIKYLTLFDYSLLKNFHLSEFSIPFNKPISL